MNNQYPSVLRGASSACVKTKAQTLESLSSCIENAIILPLRRLSYLEFSERVPGYERSVFAQLNSKRLVVRSSFSQEDSEFGSMAGMFQSILDVKSAAELTDAIEAVFASYPEGFATSEEVLIQAMAEDVKHCGVIFTREQSTNAPYWIISDDTSGSTDTVTSGDKGDIATYYLALGAQAKEPLLIKLRPLIEELSRQFGELPIDIEYAIDQKGQVILFQVRRLLQQSQVVDTSEHHKHIAKIHCKIEASMQPHPFLFGSTTVFGVMPDWNPAEIIGLYPKPLSLSLYKGLITDSTWAYQRDNYGYKNLRSFPLMIDFLGLPYIDVRVSFNSFLPREIQAELGNKLVDYYLQMLRDNPKSHDSVEFDIVFSCYTPSMQKRLSKLLEHGFSGAECEQISSHLLNLTNKIIDPRTGLWIQDLHKIEKLKRRHQQTQHDFKDPLERVYWLLEDCKRYGTLPFAGLARAAFIAVQFMQSLRENQILTDTEHDVFMASLNTISSEMQDDFDRLTKAQFLALYGHLRPGTYDVLSARYDASPELYFNWRETKVETTSQQSKTSLNTGTHSGISAATYSRINSVLAEQGINHSADSLLHFIKCAIEGREYAKFIFTRSLSDAMEDFVIFGEHLGFSREQMAYANITIVDQLITGSEDPKLVLGQSIKKGMHLHQSGEKIKLPILICDPAEVYEFKVLEARPSYITKSQITGETIMCSPGAELKDKIVFIASADPGYDWIFSHQIKGFVTAFGGCNSHMAIRAAELSIPAIIGAGELMFEKWKQASVLSIDCAANTTQVIT